jgi:hypothetical protein
MAIRKAHQMARSSLRLFEVSCLTKGRRFSQAKVRECLYYCNLVRKSTTNTAAANNAAEKSLNSHALRSIDLVAIEK